MAKTILIKSRLSKVQLTFKNSNLKLYNIQLNLLKFEEHLRILGIDQMGKIVMILSRLKLKLLIE